MLKPTPHAAICLAIGMAGTLFALPAGASNSASPDQQERNLLAKQQVHCAGVFTVFQLSLTPGNPNYAELRKTFEFATAHHAQATIRLLGDKDLAKSEIEKAAVAFGKNVAAVAEKKGNVRTLADAETEQCARSLVKTARYFEREAKAYAGSGQAK